MRSNERRAQAPHHHHPSPPIIAERFVMAFDFNVDVKLTDANDPASVQFINMTIE
ncbi:hypothetical protein [Nocardia xishanensis]